MVPVTFSQAVAQEGSFAQAVCTVTQGDEPLKISWSFHGAGITSDLDIITQNIGTRTSILIINSVGHKHRGSYTCMATNKAGSVSSTAELKVNGRDILGESRIGRERPRRHT